MFCLSITLQNIISGVFPLPLYWGAARPAHRPALAWLTEKRYSSWLYGADIGKFSCVPSWHQQTSDNSFLTLVKERQHKSRATPPRQSIQGKRCIWFDGLHCQKDVVLLKHAEEFTQLADPLHAWQESIIPFNMKAWVMIYATDKPNTW